MHPDGDALAGNCQCAGVQRGGAVLNDINFWVDERNAAARQKSTVTPKRRSASLSQQDVDGVEKFVFFVGNARSGSIVLLVA